MKQSHFHLTDLIFPALTGAVLGTDLYLKSRARKGFQKKEILHHTVKLQNSRNDGAALNAGQHHPLIIRVISVVLTLLILVMFILTLGTVGNTLLKTGLSLLLGGAFSNTYDRLHQHYVTDYLSFNFGPKKAQNIVYNIGDFAIVIGSLLSVLALEGDDE